MKKVRIISLLLMICLLAGCGQAQSGEAAFIDEVEIKEITLEVEAVALASAPPAKNDLLLPEASGKLVQRNGNASIDYSNTVDGYVMVRYNAANTKQMMVQVTGPTTTYTYYLPAQAWVTFPLSDGNGGYKVTVLENTTEKKYAVLASASFTVDMEDEFAPFIRPNQYVDYGGAVDTIAKAEELAGGVTDPLEKVEKVYDFVVNNLAYDTKRAAAVKSGYLPDLDSVLAEKKGICFDYAALMAGMLRSQGVPCKLVVGYAGTQYHAWISVWSEKDGWIDGAIFFNGSSWQRMDPTFASSGKGDEAIMKYIGDGSNYTAKYLY